MGLEDRLRAGLSDLAEGAGWTDMEDRVARASRRMAIRRRVAMSVAAAALVVAAVPVVLMSRSSPNPPDHLGDPASPTETATPAPSTSSGRPSSTPSSASASASNDRETTGCPVSAATLLATLPNAHLGTDFGHPTRLSEVTCYKRYATALPVPPVGSVRILFGYTLPERTWIALNAGPAGMCDRYVLDEAISSRLPGC
ncbi:hypothetical protein [Virgisporangium aurantiacum]|uniref:Uncharacterized protein n=1 Tax=Virgisporangium aurantiacum TaxID=175570 RepID=A0A8J3ZLM1_9ACTN|nr:hypothetical protein [Virgisporangium aurantiacum]GIJ63773.1 hypothetical protein Vau01_112890 [Virgisporangium aurantiacum]